jgi:hypothetical protein
MTKPVKGNEHIRKQREADAKSVATPIAGVTRLGLATVGGDIAGGLHAPDVPVALSVTHDDAGTTISFEPTRRTDWRHSRGHKFRLDDKARAALVAALEPPASPPESAA